MRTFFAADPDADPALVEFVQTELVTGGSGVRGIGAMVVDHAYVYEETVARSMAGNDREAEARLGLEHIPSAVPEREGAIGTDVVVLLRTEVEPSRETSTVARLARRMMKPVHVLTLPGVEAGVNADEVHEIQLDPGWDQLQELRRWSISLPARFGPEFLREAP